MRRALHLLLALSVHVVTAILGLGPGRIRRAFRRVDTAQAAPLPREVVPIAWAMCAMVAAAAVLMEVKPW